MWLFANHVMSCDALYVLWCDVLSNAVMRCDVM